MNTMLLKAYVKFQNLTNSEEGQDLVEYALLVALLSLFCVAAIGLVANSLSTKFSGIATTITNAG
jgi:Flp pilus assembly pilin Flp